MEDKMEYQIKRYNTPNLPCDYYIANADGNKVTNTTPHFKTAQMMMMVQQQVNDDKYRTHAECEELFADMIEML
tara:strand:+ start:243 stop:464 length:222 start_codon:yes stop_codon:yes gene_type:complete